MPDSPAARFAILAGALMLARIVLRAFWFPLLEEFWIFALVLRALLFLAGLALIVSFFVQLKRKELEPWHLAPAVVALAVYFFAMDKAEDFSLRQYFRAHKPAYQAAVQRWQGLSEEQIRAAPREIGERIDVGPPFHVGYSWPGSFLDDWCGAVYDPGATLVPSSEKPAAFGVYLVYCQPLEGAWRYCCFT